MDNTPVQELLALGVEPAEERVKSWLSNSNPWPASFESNFENYSDLLNVGRDLQVMQEQNDSAPQCSETNSPNNRDASRNRRPKPRSVKSGIEKYFMTPEDVRDTTLASDSDSLSSSFHYRPYCKAERKSILQYIVENDLFAFIKGNFIWQQMEKEKLCSRTWQSMKTQFQKYIYPHLDEFALEKSVRNRFADAMERTLARTNERYLEPGQRGWRRNCKFYSFMEDTLILYYVLERHRYQFTHGNAMWKRMQMKNIVPGRSWHSLKSRYKKFLAKYVETYASKNKRTVNFIGAVERTKLLNKFQLDYLVHMAVFKSSTSKSSKEAMKQLKSLGLEFSVLPVPGNSANKNELEDIKNCAYVMVQQLSEKVEQLIQSHENITQKKERIQCISPKGSSDDPHKLQGHAISFTNKANDVSDRMKEIPGARRKQIIETSDSSENNQHSTRICKTVRHDNKNVELNLKSGVNDTSANNEQRMYASSNKIKNPECSIYKTTISFSDEVETDESDDQSNADAPDTFADKPLNVKSDDEELCHQNALNTIFNGMPHGNEKTRRPNISTKSVTTKGNSFGNLQTNLTKGNPVGNLQTNFQHTELTHSLKENKSNISIIAKEDNIRDHFSCIPENNHSKVPMFFNETICQPNQENCVTDDTVNSQMNMINDDYGNDNDGNDRKPIAQTNKSLQNMQDRLMTNISFDDSFNPNISLDITKDVNGSDILASVKDLVTCTEYNSKNDLKEANYSHYHKSSEKPTVCSELSTVKLRDSSEASNIECAMTLQTSTDLIVSSSEDEKDDEQAELSLRIYTDDSESENSP